MVAKFWQWLNYCNYDSTPALFPELYHPFVITNDDLGGYWRMPKDGSRRKKTRIYAGVKYTFRGIPQVSRTIYQSVNFLSLDISAYMQIDVLDFMTFLEPFQDWYIPLIFENLI